MDKSAETSLEELISRTYSDTLPARAQAIAALGVIPGHNVRICEHLVSLLQDPDNIIRACAVQALSKREIPHKPMQDILQILRQSAPEIRHSAIEICSKLQIGEQLSVEDMLDYLADPDAHVRKYAIGLLAAARHAAVQPQLISALQDQNFEVRMQAAEGLGMLEAATEQVVQALRAALLDEEQLVRREAAWSLGRLRAAAAIPHLLRVAEDADSNDEETQASALDAIGMMGETARPFLPRLREISAQESVWMQHSLDRAVSAIEIGGV